MQTTRKFVPISQVTTTYPITGETSFTERSVQPPPTKPPYSHTPSTVTQKTAIGAVIVVISIIAVLLIASVTYYFTTDPWEKGDSTQSTVNRNYFREQYSYYAYSPPHQTPYILLHLYAPCGDVYLVPETVMNWNSKTKNYSEARYSPIFQIQFKMLGEMLGLSRLRKRGLCLSSYEVLEHWKQEQFFPFYEKEEIVWSQEGLPSFVKNQLFLKSVDIQVPIAALSWLFQPSDESTETRIHVFCKIISAEIFQEDSVICLFFVPSPENALTEEFFRSILQEMPQERKYENTTENTSVNANNFSFRCSRLEAFFYNPEWAHTVLTGIYEKRLLWNDFMKQEKF